MQETELSIKKTKGGGGYLERKIESNRGIISENTAPIPPPKRQNPFFFNRTNNAINHTIKPPMSPTNNRYITLLCLQQQLCSLNWGYNRVYHSTHHRTSH
ncbi:hypothetical protein Hanom_Chr17g01534381 [Helianthus anomalus]